MNRLRLALAVTLGLIFLLPVQAIDKPKAAPLPSRRTDISSGKQTFQEYCAACHGANGHGSSKTPAWLRTAVPDLSTIAKRRHIKDVSGFVQAVLGDDKLPAHKAGRMPDWRPILFRLSGANDDQAMARRVNLGNYVASLQGK